MIHLYLARNMNLPGDLDSKTAEPRLQLSIMDSMDSD